MRYDVVIVGAGMTGATAARLLAEAGEKVLILDRRSHIGGNCYDEYDAHGILIHRYGPHIFHTNHRQVWDFLSRFTEWRHYEHRVRACVDGKMLPFPINPETLNLLYGLSLDAEQMAGYLESVKENIDPIANSRDSVISRIGTDLYEKFFKNYTLKQWGIPAEQLQPSVCERIPIRLNGDDRYFNDTYQGMPLQGYTKLFEKMLSHENITTLLNTDYANISRVIESQHLIYTGPVDEYFQHCLGRLGYRSLRFDFKNIATISFQEYAVINYPNDFDFTRITEYKKLTGHYADSTTVSYEYPRQEGDPYYPLPTQANARLYEKYSRETGKLKNIFFAGRLGSYRYMNMDVACLEAMNLVGDLLK